MPRFCDIVCVYCVRALFYRARCICSLVSCTWQLSECGCVVSLCFLFIVCFIFVVAFFVFVFCFCCYCYCIFYAEVLWHCVCVCMLCAGVVCSRTLYVCARVVRMTAECGCVVSLCFFFFIYCLFIFVLVFFLLYCFCIFYAKICGTRMCVVHGRYMLARVVCVRLCSAHNSRVWLCCEFFFYYLLVVLFFL